MIKAFTTSFFSVKQLTGQLICVFVFAYVRSSFSHNAAHLPYQCSSIMQPGMVIVEVPFSCMVRLVGEIVQLEEEGQICQSSHLKL